MNELRKLIKRLGNGRPYLILLLLRAPFDAFRTWMYAGLLKSTFEAIEYGASSRLIVNCIIYSLICALLFFYNGSIWAIYAAFAARSEALIRRCIFQRVMELPLKKIDERSIGEWFTRLNSDVQMAYTLMNGAMNIPHAMNAVVNVMLSTILLFRSNIFVFFMVWLFVLPHLLISQFMIAKPMTALKTASLKALADNTSRLEPIITEAETILLYDAKELVLKQFEESSFNIRKANMRIHKRNTFGSAILPIFGMGGYLVILCIGNQLIHNGTYTFGELSYAFQFRGGILLGALSLCTCISNIKANIAGVKSVNETLK